MPTITNFGGGGGGGIKNQYGPVTAVATLAAVSGSVSGTYTAPANGIIYAWYYNGNTNSSRYCNIQINGSSNIPVTRNSTAAYVNKGDVITYDVKSSGYSGGGVYFVNLD